MQKRGQAAMEFLMTYGWALLVVLIAIGALAFFGVLNPSKFLPQSCMLGPGLACEDFRVIYNTDPGQSRIQINVRNGMGRDFEFFYIYVDKKIGNEICGGYLGIVAHPIWSPLRDGQALPVVPFIPGPPSTGINCARIENCCNNPVYTVCADYPTCSITAPACNLLCAGSTLIPETGSKFSEDLVIVYKELGSNIIHQRVGHLTAQIE